MLIKKNQVTQNWKLLWYFTTDCQKIYFHALIKYLKYLLIRKAFWEALWGQVVGIEATKSQHQTNSVDSIPTIIEKWGGSTIKNNGRQRHTLTHSSTIRLGIKIYTFLNFALQFNEHYLAFLEFRMANKFHQIILLTTVNPTRTMVYCLSAQEIKFLTHKISETGFMEEFEPPPTLY